MPRRQTRAGGWRRSMAAVLLILALGAVAASCDLLYPGFGWAGYGEVPDMPEVEATYTTGTATVSITRDGTTEELVLDEVTPGSQLSSFIGASVGWQNDEGWRLQVLAYDF